MLDRDEERYDAVINLKAVRSRCRYLVVAGMVDSDTVAVRVVVVATEASEKTTDGAVLAAEDCESKLSQGVGVDVRLVGS